MTKRSPDTRKLMPKGYQNGTEIDAKTHTNTMQHWYRKDNGKREMYVFLNVEGFARSKCEDEIINQNIQNEIKQIQNQ